MPDRSQPPPEPEIEIQIIGEVGDTTDPIYNKMVALVINTIKDVHLLHAQDGLLSTAQMERGLERMVVVFVHNLEVIDGEFDDAMSALLNRAAPLVQWNISFLPKGVMIQGAYLHDMPIDAIAV